MRRQTISVRLGRTRLPVALARQLNALKPRARSRVLGMVIIAHTHQIDIAKLASARDDMRRLGIVINQSLRLSLGVSVDRRALVAATQLINSLRT